MLVISPQSHRWGSCKIGTLSWWHHEQAPRLSQFLDPPSAGGEVGTQSPSRPPKARMAAVQPHQRSNKLWCFLGFGMSKIKGGGIHHPIWCQTQGARTEFPDITLLV